MVSSLACLHSADSAMCSPNKSLTDLARPSFRKKWPPQALTAGAVLGGCGTLGGEVELEKVGHQK